MLLSALHGIILAYLILGTYGAILGLVSGNGWLLGRLASR